LYNQSQDRDSNHKTEIPITRQRFQSQPKSSNKQPTLVHMSTLFSLSKKLLPRISSSEMIALKSGTVSLDRNIMADSVHQFDFKKLSKSSSYQANVVNEQTSKLCNSIGGNELVFQDGKLNQTFKKALRDTKAFSYIIKEKYGGLQLNVETQSRILVKLTSHNPSAGVTVMVPNSLGPGELLQHYGTQEQKEKYLPGLSDASYIPCFGLTGPRNGSDAVGDGMIDRGEVVEVDGNLHIKININKRYITLAPISNLIGLAFHLEDPNYLLKSGRSGITVALLEKHHPGLDQKTYHNPLNVGFPNGTLKGSLMIPIDQVVGGERNCGKGWKMLMECLAAGRGVSLPASALGSSWIATYGVGGYANIRKQFKIPLSKMQGVQEKLATATYSSLLIDSSVRLTNAILDSGEKPAVISAIMKEQTTERGRKVLDNTMDVYAGSGICLGNNNFLSKFYQSLPVGITVEGSNTLTRSLIIFGQGLNKSHPYIGSIVTNIQDNQVSEFNTNIKKMIAHTLKCYAKSILTPTSFKSQPDSVLRSLNTSFAHMVNVVALMGGALKKEQIISGHMADIFSNIYLGYALNYNFEHNQLDERTRQICLTRLNNETLQSISKVRNALPPHLLLLLVGCTNTKPVTIPSTDIEYLSGIVWNCPKMKKHVEGQIHIDGVVDKIKRCNEKFDQKLVDEIVQVGEFNID
jgi:acyl-CoA dehydrogenase